MDETHPSYPPAGDQSVSIFIDGQHLQVESNHDRPPRPL